MPEVARRVRPRAVLLGNLFRDQLDRYGELEHVAAGWREALAGLPETSLVVNADDPLLGELARAYRGRFAPSASTTTGMPGLRSSTRPTPSTARPAAGPSSTRRPTSGTSASTPALPGTSAGRRSTSRPADRAAGARRQPLRASTPAGAAPIRLALPGLYNVYNATAAAALAGALGVPREIAPGLESFTAAFGRFERITIGDSGC